MIRPGSHRRIPRRSSGGTRTGSWLNFDPRLMNPEFWFDASDTATITSSSGAVSQWDDKSGNGRNVSQSTAGNKPTTGSTTQNGLNVIKFDGGDYLGPSATGWDPNAGSGVTFFIVTQSTDNGASQIAFSQQDLGGTGRNIMARNATASGSFFVNLGGGANAPAVLVTANPTLLTFRGATGANANRSLTRDRYLSNTNIGTIETTTGGLVIGSSKTYATFWNGWIGEIIIYGTLMTYPDIVTVENYLWAKWGVVPS